MDQITTAIYENGVFRLLQSVDLEEGEEVKITVKMLNVIPDQTEGKRKTKQISKSVSPKTTP